MLDGFYKDPKHPTEAKAKIAVVITFYNAGRKDYGYFVDDKMQSLLMNLAAHKHFKAGVEYDLIIVDHGPDELHFPDEPGYKIIRKPNFGFSFGGWKQAWEEFGDQYDFYCFTEDDIAPACDDWLLKILTRFMLTADTGAVGNVVEQRGITEPGNTEFWAAAQTDRDMMYNFDGGFTFTSSKVLRQVDQIGGLTVFDVGPDKWSATVNEVLFQDQILELGYRLVSFADGQHFLIHGSEIFSNDVMFRTGPPAPLMNLNGRHKIPEVAELYKFLENTI